MHNEKRVVITGCGVATPLGIGIDALWEGLINRACGIKPIAAYDASGFKSTLGAEVPDYKMGDYVPKNYRKSTKVMARDIELAVVSAYHAVKHANLITKCLIARDEATGEPSVDSTRFGANIGAGLICADLQELSGALQTSGDHATGDFDLQKWGEDGMTHLTPLWLLKFLPNMLGCHVTIVHDAQAPSNTITCGEASSHLAVGEAYRTIARGSADVCICGGAESKMNPMSVMRQELAGRLVEGRDADPATACKPFDTSANGMVAGEGGGLLILEELEFAKKRGARILAEVTGFGAATSISSWHEPESDGAGMTLAIGNALKDAGLKPESVDLITTFSTGINAYDDAEAASLKTVFGEREGVPAIALKGVLGNSGAGAGAIDLAATVMALHHNTLPPSANTASPSTGGLLRFAQDEPVDVKVTTAVSYAYALSGSQNAAIVIRKFEG
ncbi:MAG: beta-ketoacyl-[acyl-carrier-protein] synthase family protein [Phycisphaerales bacterium]|nr:beta-ketoacyl-[acyl-carrier-protein] synthase family protein [Phycisphaerales bacterium]